MPKQLFSSIGILEQHQSPEKKTKKTWLARFSFFVLFSPAFEEDKLLESHPAFKQFKVTFKLPLFVMLQFAIRCYHGLADFGLLFGHFYGVIEHRRAHTIL